MKVRPKKDSTSFSLVLPQILHELSAVVAAIVGRNGILQEANIGFTRLLPDGAGPLQDVRGSFVNPRFDQFAARGANGDDGVVYRGVVNIGDAMGAVRSLRGTIYGADDKLLIVAEPDIAEIEKSLAVLERLNAQLSGERCEAPETTISHDRRSSHNGRNSLRKVGSSIDAGATRPTNLTPEILSGQTSDQPTVRRISSAKIPVDVAITLLRIGFNEKFK